MIIGRRDFLMGASALGLGGLAGPALAVLATAIDDYIAAAKA